MFEGVKNFFRTVYWISFFFLVLCMMFPLLLIIGIIEIFQHRDEDEYWDPYY